MVEWLKTCAVDQINLIAAFHERKTFSFPMVQGIQKEDLLYLYLRAPFDTILYKGIVTDIDQSTIPSEEARYYQADLLIDVPAYFRVELLEKYPPDLLTADFLAKNGLLEVPEWLQLSETLVYNIEYHEVEGDEEEHEEEEGAEIEEWY